MIFAAGMGTRLRPLTDRCPKALIEVAGKTMLERLIMKLKASGFDEIVVNVHHLADRIIDFIAANDNFGITVHISDERNELLETGGGLQRAAPFFANDRQGFLVHNVDILSNCNLTELMNDHREHQALATLLVSSRRTDRYLLFDEANRLHGWIDKKTGATKPAAFAYREGKYREYAYAGIQAVAPAIYDILPAGKYSIIDFYLARCRSLEIRGFVANKLMFLDIGKPETLAEAERFIQALQAGPSAQL
ncbi:nucleotidyltransferase family protein [Phocaeicola abscessus]|uniref:nucleotidyltransferase family protein n=1 Tax=Phocaeicola abscessus TaxID=555313 RepID=UPI0004B4515E|nr:nucleotidyltransferase family protein [Phocaeicola abscessus]